MRNLTWTVLGLAMLGFGGCGGCQPGPDPEDAVTEDPDISVGSKEGKTRSRVPATRRPIG